MLVKTTSISLIVSTLVLFSACSNDFLNKTPKCSDSDVISTLSDILNTDSRKATIDADIVREIELNKDNGMRTCQTSVDYVYSVDNNNPFTSSINKVMSGSIDGVSKSNNIVYTVVLGDTGRKSIVNVKEN